MNDQEFAEFITNCSEVELYYTINETGGFVWHMNRQINRGHVPEKDIEGVRRDIQNMHARTELAVAQTPRFGVTNPWTTKKSIFTGEDMRVASDEYWLWFRWWDAWSKSLSDERFKELDKAMSAKQGLSAWRPGGDWRVAEFVSG